MDTHFKSFLGNWGIKYALKGSKYGKFFQPYSQNPVQAVYPLFYAFYFLLLSPGFIQQLNIIQSYNHYPDNFKPTLFIVWKPPNHFQSCDMRWK